MRARAQPRQGMGGGAACCAGRGQRPETGAAVEAGASAGHSGRQLLDAHVKRPSLGSRGVRAGVHPGPGSPGEAPQSETAQVVQGSGFSPPSPESSLQVCGISALVLEWNALIKLPAPPCLQLSAAPAVTCKARSGQWGNVRLGVCLPRASDAAGASSLCRLWAWDSRTCRLAQPCRAGGSRPQCPCCQ